MEPVMRTFRRLFGKHLGALALALFCAGASHAIPASERAVLLAIYSSTNGAGWGTSTNWNGPVGTECTWYGVTCNAGNANVVAIDLRVNQLTGVIPSLTGLTALTNFNVSANQLTGAIPALTGLTALVSFDVSRNQLTGAIPSLTGVTALLSFDVSRNQLTGAIPSLTGLTALIGFNTSSNQLTGAIPVLTGLTALRVFSVSNNQLTGSIPALTGLTALREFYVNNNQLTGAIPALTELTALRYFDAASNLLTGAIPSLTGLIALEGFFVTSNKLTGAIPALTGLTALQYFYATDNQLTGSIPALTGLTALRSFFVDNNQLTGAVPSLAGLALNPNASRLCPNQLTPSIDPAWDAATPGTTWSIGCTAPLPQQVLLVSVPATFFVAGRATFSASVQAGTPVSGPPIRYSSLTPEVCTINTDTGEAIALPNPASPFCDIAANKAGDATVNSAVQQVARKRLSALSASCRLDVNGDGVLQAGIDGLLILRYLSGFRGAGLISGLTLVGTRDTAPAIESFLATQNLNVRDTPAGVASPSDGLVLYRYLQPLLGSAMVAGSELSGSDPDLARSRFAGWCTP
jgi:Leucine-rich repeat (LRR) protein